MKFFIKYYKQLKFLPITDIVAVENYSAEELKKRILSAKKIINSNLTEIAIKEILEQYSDFLSPEELQQAKNILDEIAQEDNLDEMNQEEDFSDNLPPYLQQNSYAFHKTKGLVKIYAIDESIHFIDKHNEKYFTKIEKISNFSQPFQVGDIVDHRLFGEVKITSVTNTTVTVTHKNNPPRMFTINDFAKNVIQLTKSKISLDDKPEQKNQNKKEINTMEKLIANRWKQLGTNSRTIYLDCCEKYGWKKELANKLGYQGSLRFVENATNEGYNVWFLTHSNLNDSNAIRWKNKITEDLLTVTQYNTINGEENDTKNGTRTIKNLRIVFAKTRLSTGEGYAFLGVYKFVERIPLYNNPDYVAKYVFKQVSREYPIEKPITIPEWLKIGEKVEHRILGQVTITYLDERNNTISIKDENGKEHSDLDLENCLNKKVFSPI